MSDENRVRKMLGLHRTADVPDIPPQTDDEDNEYRSVSFGRVGAKPIQSITFRLEGGDEYDFEYSHRYSGQFDRSGTYTITFTSHTVTLEGRNLTKLVEYLRMHRVALVQAVDGLHADAGKPGECVVTTITVEALEE